MTVKKVKKKPVKKKEKIVQFGRPSTYNPKYIEDIFEYLEKTQDEVYDYIKSESSGSTSNSVSREKKVNVKLPSKYGFRKFINKKYNMRVARSTMQDWEANHQDFRVSLLEIQDEQKERLQDMGLSGLYEKSLTKLHLAASHGMSDRQDINVKETSYVEFLDNQTEEGE